MSEKILNYQEAALYLGIPVGTLYGWVSKRAVPHIRLGRRLVRFSEPELYEWLNRHRIESKPPEWAFVKPQWQRKET